MNQENKENKENKEVAQKGGNAAKQAMQKY